MPCYQLSDCYTDLLKGRDGVASYISLFVNISTEGGKVINGESKRGLWEGPNFEQAPQFLKSNRISLAYGVTSNKEQTFIDKS